MGGGHRKQRKILLRAYAVLSSYISADCEMCWEYYPIFPQVSISADSRKPGLNKFFWEEKFSLQVNLCIPRKFSETI